MIFINLSYFMQISSKKTFALYKICTARVHGFHDIFTFLPDATCGYYHYHLRPSMNKPRSFPTIHLYDLIYAETSIYASSGFGPLGPKPCGGDYYYYYLRIFTEDKHFSIIHTVINMCPPDPITYILYIHKILTNCKIR